MIKFSEPNKVKYPPTSDVFESILRQQVIEMWFPRCFDEKYGGFLCDFDREWNACGEQQKLLEFQSRQTWIAAELSLLAPENNNLKRAITQGFDFFKNVMWDRQIGGWFHLVDRAGNPLEAQTKHLHGMVYAINSCVAVYTTTQNQAAFDLACQTFNWLEDFAHDRQYGGYRSFFKADGTVISDVTENPLNYSLDTIGTPLGLKDTNCHSDLLESFTYLYRVWPDPTVKERLDEIVDILSQRILYSSGALAFLCEPDWKPIPHIMRFGHALQTASRLLDARDLLANSPKIIEVAKRLVDFCLTYAWDRELGGFFYASPGSLPMELEGYDLIVRRKAWWIQFEGLKALLSLSRVVENNATYWQYFKKQWEYIQQYLIDWEYGGVYVAAQEKSSNNERLENSLNTENIIRKGSIWKDASHEGMVLLYCLKTVSSQIT